MSHVLLGVGLWLGAVFSLSATTVPIVGYQSTIRTIVFEDGSMSRVIRIVLTADQPEALIFKKSFLVRNGYSVIERSFEGMPGLEATKIFVPTSFEPVLNDQVSRIHIRQVKDTVFYNEEFHTTFLTSEVEASELKNDLPAVKVLLADTQFDFLTILPGKVTTALSGDFSQDSIRWAYDVERLFAHPSFTMSAQSSVYRQEELSWILVAVSFLVTTIGLLILIKARVVSRLQVPS